jgi:hypothetical protein
VFKPKIITGDNITSIASFNREMLDLEREIQTKLHPVDRDYVVYSYHFVRLGNLLLAQKYLNRVSTDYFDSGIWKDLTHALMVASIHSAAGKSMTPPASKLYEYFTILNRAIVTFEDVYFEQKPAFNRFKKTFQEFTTAPRY